MSILIKGMEMPKDIEPGLVIEFADGIDGKRYARLYHYQHGGLTEWLEAISIPDHGRLIDGDALRQAMYHEAFETDSPMQKWDSGCWIRYKMFERMEEAAPTIIPASGGSENE